MWLINTKTLRLENVPGGQAPPYAILSHTWEEDEVSYQDFQDEARRVSQQGFEKILFTCEQALNDGLGYAWVDTCCIDKTSSAELSEAINSMFICKWFTRGWTLQELVAPQKLIFYDSSWKAIGTRTNLTDDISRVTGISSDILRGGDLSSVSVAKRMSWAANRETRREEDIAYCLMGIFDVNMPMLYVEGRKAFIRLQEEILKEIEDQSLFAWKASTKSAWDYPFRGVFASSPREFAGCDDIVPFRDLSSAALGAPTTVTAKGVPLMCIVDIPFFLKHDAVLVSLNCRRENDFENVIAVEARCQGGDRFLRSSPSELFSRSSHGAQETIFLSKSVHAARMPFLSEGKFSIYLGQLPEDVKMVAVHPRSVRYNPNSRLIQLGTRVDETVAVELQVSGHYGKVLLLLWTTRLERWREYEARFRLLEMVSLSHSDVLSMQQATKLRDLSTMSISLGHGVPGLAVSGSKRRIQGADRLCVELKRR